MPTNYTAEQSRTFCADVRRNLMRTHVGIPTSTNAELGMTEVRMPEDLPGMRGYDEYPCLMWTDDAAVVDYHFPHLLTDGYHDEVGVHHALAHAWPFCAGVNPLFTTVVGEEFAARFPNPADAPEITVPIGWRELGDEESSCALDIVISTLDTGGEAPFPDLDSTLSGVTHDGDRSGPRRSSIVRCYRHPLITDQLAAALRDYAYWAGNNTDDTPDFLIREGLRHLPRDLFRRLPFLLLASWPELNPVTGEWVGVFKYLPVGPEFTDFLPFAEDQTQTYGGDAQGTPVRPASQPSRPRIILPKSVHSIPLPLP